jgi:N-acetylglutamate synthase-like GNAT family acetyltransferase
MAAPVPTLRLFQPHDRAACLALFDSNAPPFFAPEERPDFERFLNHPPETYFVVEDRPGRVVACGGFAANPSAGLGELTWGMVARTEHGKGIGRFLLRARLLLLAQRHEIARVRLDTSQHTRGFFERDGFVVVSHTPDGYAPGLHRYEMTLPLDRERREQIRRDASECGAAAAVATLPVGLTDPAR